MKKPLKMQKVKWKWLLDMSYRANNDKAFNRFSLLRMVEATTTLNPLMIEVTKDTDFLVSALPEGKEDFSSYVEVLVTPKDEVIYDYLIKQVGTLNIVGIGQELKNVGEKYDDAIYCLYVPKEIHTAVVNGENIAHIEENKE